MMRSVPYLVAPNDGDFKPFFFFGFCHSNFSRIRFRMEGEGKMNVISINSCANWSHCTLAGVANVNSLTMLQNHFRLKSEIWVICSFLLFLQVVRRAAPFTVPFIFLLLRNRLRFRHSAAWSAPIKWRTAPFSRLCTSTRNLPVLLVVRLMRCQTFSSLCIHFYYISKAINYFCNIRSSYMVRARVP